MKFSKSSSNPQYLCLIACPNQPGDLQNKSESKFTKIAGLGRKHLHNINAPSTFILRRMFVDIALMY